MLARWVWTYIDSELIEKSVNKAVTVGSPEKPHCGDMGLFASQGECGDCYCFTSLEASTNVAL